MYIKKSNDHRTDPCGIPVDIGLIGELDPFSVTSALKVRVKSFMLKVKCMLKKSAC